MVRLFVEHATTVLLVILSIVTFGLISYVSLPRESAPDVEIPVVIVSTPYVGVAPEDIEKLVTIPIENELASLTDVKKLSSSSSEGVSVVAIEFEPEVSIDDVLQKVRDRVNRAKPKLPGDAEEPSVEEVSFSDIPILLVTLSGGLDEQQLKQLGEDLESEMSRLPGVLEATVTGGRERQVRVQVNPDRLSFYGLSMNDIVGALQGENVDIPGGDVTAGAGTFLLRTPGGFDDVDDLSRVAVKRVGDRPVFLTDLARVTDDFEDRATYSRMNGVPSVTLGVKKRTGANILSVAESVKALVRERAQDWPEGVDFAFTGDQSTDIELMVAELENNIITALILVVGVILIFMGARNSLFVAAAIPLSMLASFLVLDVAGFTLNMVVLFSLILALGMLVDNAIVVVENVYRHLELGRTRREAAVIGTNEVAVAVAASTATTVAAFFPMVFWGGVMGQFMGYLPKTVIVVLVSSLFVAVMILPTMTSRLMRRDETTVARADEEQAEAVDVSTLHPLMQRYVSLLRYSIRYRYVSLGVGVATLLLSFVAYGQLNHGIEFFPATDPDRAVVSVRLPEGADLESTDRVVRRLEAVLASTENVENFVAEVGVSGSGNPLAGVSAQANAARITLDFLPSSEKAEPGERIRVEPTPDTIQHIRLAAKQIPGATILVEPEEMGPPVGAPIAVEVRGEDFHVVGQAANELMRKILEVEGTTDVEHDYRVGRPEMRLRVDRGAAKRVGVSTQAVGSAVRTAVAGTDATVIRDGEEEIDVHVEIAPEFKADLQSILTLRVPGREDTSPDTFPVPLSAVAGYELAGGAGTIKHIDQDLVVTIEADVQTPGTENVVQGEVAAMLAGWDAPPDVYARVGGASDEQAEAEAFLTWAFGVAVALILMVLVTQFDSFAMPAIILFTVVLSLVGVLWGLLITGTPFGIIMTGIGVISLAGVVVNNAIVLLDYVGQLQRRGLGVEDSLVRAGVTRFRPVMLTAITTTLGLVPMATGVSVDFKAFKIIWGSTSAQWWGPMAVAVIFGLSFATILTLVMVPTLYSIKADLQQRVMGWVTKPATSVAAKVGLGFVLAAAIPVHPAVAVTLDEAFAAAEDNNIDLALSAEQVVQARAIQLQATSAWLPRLSAAASFRVNQDEFAFDPGLGDVDFALPDDIDPAFAPIVEGILDSMEEGIGSAFAFDPVIIQPKQAWSANLVVSQPLFHGASIPGYMAASGAHRAASAEHRRATQQVRLATARVYYGVLTAEEAVRVSSAGVETAAHQVELAQRQLEAGLADRRVVLQAELGLARSRRDLMRAQEQRVSARQSFEQVTGLSSDVALETPEPRRGPDDLDEALKVALEARPDIEAARQRVAAAKRQRTAVDMGWAPTVDLYFVENYNQVPGFVDSNWQWQLGLNFNWSLFDGGLRIHQSRERASQVRQAMLMVEQVEEQVAFDVRLGWEKRGHAEAALTSVSKELDLARENLRLAELAFEAGTATWLDVENARIGLAGAELAQATERMNRDLAALELMLATGTL